MCFLKLPCIYMGVNLANTVYIALKCYLIHGGHMESLERTEYGEKCLKNVSTVCMFQTVLFFS